MICPKCGRKYEDDMPQCLWCDAPNPKMKKQPEPKPALEPTKEFELEPVQKIPADSRTFTGPDDECPEFSETAESEDDGKPRKGTLIFWMSIILGEAGVHCFMSGKTLRGWLYLIFGGVAFGFWAGALSPFEIYFPVAVHFIMYFTSIAVTVLTCIDAWKIAHGKYTNTKKGFNYTGAKWMTVITILSIVFSAAYTSISFVGHAKSGFLNIESYNKDLREKSIKKTSKSDSESIAAVIEIYMLKQEQFFKSENKLGRFKEIGFADTTASMYFQIQDLGAGIGVTYKSMFGCSRNSTWLYTTSIQDGKLTWYTSAPQDENCKEAFPKLYILTPNSECVNQE